jgi:cytochrome c oxidase subunit 2
MPPPVTPGAGRKVNRGEQTTAVRRRSRRRYLSTLAVVAAALVLASCSSDLPQSSLNPQSTEASDIDGLWVLTLVIMTVIFVAVEAALVYSIIRFRKRKDDDTEPKQVHGNTRLEIVWTIIPAVILAFVAVPTLRVHFDLREPATGSDVVQVEVTGHQWWWEFTYPEIIGPDGRPLITANELHIPAGKTTNLILTSADVIHSFWVPPLNGKRDLVPGQLTNLTLTPDADTAGDVIPGQCAEYCWLGHADMRMRVFVETPAGFDSWAAEQLHPTRVPTDGPAAAGYETFTQICTTCHVANILNEDGNTEVIGVAFGPDLTHFGGRETLGAGILSNTREHLAQWIDNPSDLKAMRPDLNDLAEGKVLGMPDYLLDEAQIAGLVALLEGWE